MRRRTLIHIICLIGSLSVYAQKESFSAKAYYSAPSEIIVEIENLTEQEITLLIKGESYIKLYAEREHQNGNPIIHPLETTDSMKIIAKIPTNKIHISKYKVKSKDLTKLFFKMIYSLNYTYPPKGNKWTSHSQEVKILPYDSKRKPTDKNRSINKREKLSGECVFNNPEVMPEFPGGEQELLHFLIGEAARYYFDIPAVTHVRIVIEKDGSISHPFLLIGNKPFFQKAALEIIQRMPKWKPGLNKGKPVRTFRNIMIIFKFT